MRSQTYLLDMNAAQRKAPSNPTLKASSLVAAEQIARRNLERARVLGNARAIAKAARWLAQVLEYAATVRKIGGGS